MIPAIERTMTTGTEVETVPRETSALLLTSTLRKIQEK